MKTWTFGPAHERLTYQDTEIPGAPVTLVHDVKGNLVGDENGAILHYDFDNLPSSLQLPGQLLIDCKYDAFGRKVSNHTQQSGGQVAERIYVNAGYRIICEYVLQSSMPSPKRFVHGAFLDELMMTASEAAFPVIRFFTHNHQYSTYSCSTASGSVDNLFSYAPYGTTEKFSNTGSSLPVSSDAIFTGREQLSGLGLYTFRSRLYSPSLRAFLNRDFDRYADGPNLYRFLRNNPVTGLDPFGDKYKPSCYLVRGPLRPTPRPSVRSFALGASGFNLSGSVGSPVPIDITEQMATSIECVKIEDWDFEYRCHCNCYTPGIGGGKTEKFRLEIPSDPYTVSVGQHNGIWLNNFSASASPSWWPDILPDPSVQFAGGWQTPGDKSRADAVCESKKQGVTWPSWASVRKRVPKIFECDTSKKSPAAPW